MKAANDCASCLHVHFLNFLLQPTQTQHAYFKKLYLEDSALHVMLYAVFLYFFQVEYI